MKLAIVVPVYNESKRAVDTINKILLRTNNLVVVIDDGSKDDSWKCLNSTYKNNKQVILLKHVINLGKGAAMKTGVTMAWKKKSDGVIFIDADGQHNPEHLKKFEEALEKCDLVFGFRSLGTEMPTIRRWGNLFSINLIKLLFKLKRKDLLCGYFGFKRNIYKEIEWLESRYGVETEIACRVGKKQIPFKEVKIDTIYIDKYKGVTIFDAFKILFKLPYWYFRK